MAEKPDHGFRGPDPGLLQRPQGGRTEPEGLIACRGDLDILEIAASFSLKQLGNLGYNCSVAKQLAGLHH